MGGERISSPRPPSGQDGGPRAPRVFCSLGRDRYFPGGHDFLAREAIPGSGFARTGGNFFAKARRRLEVERNVRLLNLASEEGLETAIEISESPVLNFWLDGHYSAGGTYEGVRDTPIEIELQTISKFLESERLMRVAVFVDDVRLFAVEHREKLSAEEREGYPRLLVLCSWAENLGLVWTIEHDIFIAKSIVST